jgi:hypothetical protein
VHNSHVVAVGNHAHNGTNESSSILQNTRKTAFVVSQQQSILTLPFLQQCHCSPRCAAEVHLLLLLLSLSWACLPALLSGMLSSPSLCSAHA